VINYQNLFTVIGPKRKQLTVYSTRHIQYQVAYNTVIRLTNWLVPSKRTDAKSFSRLVLTGSFAIFIATTTVTTYMIFIFVQKSLAVNPKWNKMDWRGGERGEGGENHRKQCRLTVEQLIIFNIKHFFSKPNSVIAI